MNIWGTQLEISARWGHSDGKNFAVNHSKYDSSDLGNKSQGESVDVNYDIQTNYATPSRCGNNRTGQIQRLALLVITAAAFAGNAKFPPVAHAQERLTGDDHKEVTREIWKD